MDVRQELLRRFAAPLPEYYTRRIVVFKDDQGGFAADVEQMELPDVRILIMRENEWFTLRRQKGVYLHCICVFHPDVCLRTFQSPWAARYQRMTLTLALPGQVRLKVRSIPVQDAEPCLAAVEQET